MYNIKFISWIRDNISPALARTVEIGIISGIIYILVSITTLKFNMTLFLSALLTPVIAGLTKYLRDNDKQG